MKKVIWIIVLFLGLPAGIYFALNDALTDQQSKWYRAVVKEVPQEQQSQLALESACYNPTIRAKVNLAPVCGPYENTKRLRSLAVGVALIPLVYGVVLLLLSTKCRTDRDLLFKLFRPGVYGSTLLVAILILLQWLLISGVAYGYAFGELETGEYFWIGFLGLTALAGAYFTMKPVLNGFPKATTTVLGVKLGPDEEPKLWSFVRDLATKVGARVPDNLVVGFTPNFFATEAKVVCASGTYEGETMYMSLPLCRIMSRSELAAVVLHELAHFKGEDVKFSIHFYPIYRGIAESIAGVSNASARVANLGKYIPFGAFKLIFAFAGLTLLPSVYLLNFFFEAFSKAENSISRERELAADALGARIEGQRAMGAVLVKVVAYSHVWRDLVQWAREAHKAGVVNYGGKSYEPRQWFYNMSQIFAEMATHAAGDTLLEGLGGVETPHPTDTHPPLGVRLKALSMSVEAVTSEALKLDYEAECATLFEDMERLEICISDIEWQISIA